MLAGIVNINTTVPLFIISFQCNNNWILRLHAPGLGHLWSLLFSDHWKLLNVVRLFYGL